MTEGWYEWTIKGWELLDNKIIDKFINNIPRTDHNWHEYKYRRNYRDDIISFCWPPKEMKKLFNLFDDDIATIYTSPYTLNIGYGHSFSIYRYIDNPEKERDIRGGRKPKFFLV
jgi:hypothetical protein